MRTGTPCWCVPTASEAIAGDVGYTKFVAALEATDTLMRGFTTVRDLGGPAFGLKQAIDEGLVAGPRIFPSRRDDHRHQRPRRLPPDVRNPARASARRSAGWKRSAAAMVADSPDMVRMRAREQLMLGASQIKLTAGGGVASPHISDRRLDLHRGRAARRGRGGGKLGHLCDGACLYPGRDPARDRGRRQDASITAI